MPDSPSTALPTGLAAPKELLAVLLNISQTGIMRRRPVYDARSTEIIDLA